MALNLSGTAVNRVSRSGEVIGPDELTPLEALEAITINAAYQHGEESTKGSLEPGKLADLVIRQESDEGSTDVDQGHQVGSSHQRRKDHLQGQLSWKPVARYPGEGGERMSVARGRWIVRGIHLLFSIPILGYIYSPFERLPQYAPLTRFLFVPFVVLSGLWMWKGHVVRRMMGRKSG